MKRLRHLLNKQKSKSSAYSQPPTATQEAPSQYSAPVEPPANYGDARPGGQVVISSEAATLNIALRNDTNSSTVYAYITGQAIDNNNAVFLLRSDGRTAYYPDSPSNTMTPLTQDVAIPLGAPGNTNTVTIPRIAGGRIWFSVDNTLTFFLNPGSSGPALVEPSVTNPSDPSINVNWTFCEFTFNADQLYANISYVDFISIPISLNLSTVNSGSQSVAGFAQNGLNQIADALRAQNDKDGAGWDQLIVPTPGNNSVPLRVLSPNQARVGRPSLLADYFDSYVNEVYQKYQSATLSIDTQSGAGIVTGQVSPESASSGNPILQCGGSTFSKPSTSDIWTCSTGPFATGSNPETNAIIPRLSAAFNRSVLLQTESIPAEQSLYYRADITNHYSRVVHAANLDGKGYAFPYDDVQPTGGQDASGKVQAGDPLLWTVAVGGSQAKPM